MGDFRMPSLGADMDAGKLLEWYVEPGQEVHRGDIVALVDTDKAAIDVEVWDDGIVDALRAEAEAGTKLLVIADDAYPYPTSQAVATAARTRDGAHVVTTAPAQRHTARAVATR